MAHRLSQETIREILTQHSQGIAVAQIAKQYSVDGATVRYHVKQFERAYGSASNVYLLVKKVQKECLHPSMKCLICGVAQDAIRRRERVRIKELTIKLKEANTILARYGHVID